MEAEVKRQEVLTSVKLQFSSNLRRLKDNTLDQVFLGILASAECALTILELRNRYSDTTFGGVIDDREIYSVLNRLSTDRKISRVDADSSGSVKYELSVEAAQHWQDSHSQNVQKVDSIVERLFVSALEDHRKYVVPFTDVVSQIASELSGESAAYLVRNGDPIRLTTDSVGLIINKNLELHPEVDGERFRSGLETFFTAPDPDFHAYLWQVTESYFMARMLGLDQSGQALSKRLFDTWEFVLDTSFIVPLCFSSDPNHGLAKNVFRAIRNLNRPVEMLAQTQDEMQTHLDYELSQLQRFVSIGKERWLGRTDSAVLRTFSQQEAPDYDAYAEEIRLLPRNLRSKYGIRLVDDYTVSSTSDRDEFAEELANRYRRGNRTKGITLARHDADLLMYVADRRKSAAFQTWVLTFDTSLPGALPPRHEGGSLAIIPRELIQWLAPLSEAGLDEKGAAETFSQLVRERFFPSNRLFDAGDLATVLEEINESNQLTDAEVESLLVKVAANFINIDPQNASGRENLTGLIRTTRLDPTSSTNRRIAELETKLEQETNAADVRLQTEIANEREIAEQRIRLETDRAQKLQDQIDHLTEASAHRAALEVETKAVRKLWLIFACATVVIAFVSYVIIRIPIPYHGRWETWVPYVLGAVTFLGLGSLVKNLLIWRLMGMQYFEALPERYRNFLE